MQTFALYFVIGLGIAAYIFVGAEFMANALVGPVSSFPPLRAWQKWCDRHKGISITISIVFFVAGIAAFAAFIGQQ